MVFFFVGAYGWIARRNWVRIPTIIYASHVITTMVPIYATFANADIKQHNKIFLVTVYLPFLIVPLLMLWRAAAREKLFDGAAAPALDSNRKKNT
jgi:hypothetical protein